MIDYFLRALESTQQWGWVLYRTIYTPGSDQRCQEAIIRLRELMISNFEAGNEDATPEQHSEVIPKLSLVLQEDPAFEHATLDDLRAHFKEWAPRQGYFHGARFKDPRWEVFLLLDEQTLDRILSAPKTAQRNWNEFYITAVQVNFPGDSRWTTQEEKRAQEELDAGDYSNDEDEYEDEDDTPNWPGQVNVCIYYIVTFWHQLVPERMCLEK
jgi:hypothetical protein